MTEVDHRDASARGGCGRAEGPSGAESGSGTQSHLIDRSSIPAPHTSASTTMMTTRTRMTIDDEVLTSTAARFAPMSTAQAEMIRHRIRY